MLHIQGIKTSGLQIQLNKFLVHFQEKFLSNSRRFSVFFHGHLFTTEHSLTLQQVNICGLDCTEQLEYHNDPVTKISALLYKNCFLCIYSPARAVIYAIMKLSVHQNIFPGEFTKFQ